MAEHGSFHWNELMTHDAEKAKAFYGATLGWSFEAMPMDEGATYWLAMGRNGPAGGIFPMTGADFEGVPDRWFSYIAVDDVDAIAGGIETAGGKIERPAFDVPGVGRIMILQDANGAHVGYMTPAAQE